MPMSNTTECGSSNPEYLNEIEALDMRDPLGQWKNIDGTYPDPNFVGGIRPREVDNDCLLQRD